jgi:hypothetical protein
VAGVVSILLICWLCVATDYGVSPQPQYSTAHLASPASISYNSIEVRSSVLDVDLAGEVLLLEVQVQQRGPAVAAACSGPDAADYQLAIGTATPAGARPAAVMPLCPLWDTTASSSSSSSRSGGFDSAVYTVAVPIRQTNILSSPWEELAADVKLQLRCAGAQWQMLMDMGHLKGLCLDWACCALGGEVAVRWHCRTGTGGRGAS